MNTISDFLLIKIKKRRIHYYLNPPLRGAEVDVGAVADAAVDTAVAEPPPKLNPNDGAEGCVPMPLSVIPEGAVGAVVVAAVIPERAENPCVAVVEAAGTPNDKGFAAPVDKDNEGGGAVKIEVVTPLGAPPKEKPLDRVVDAPNAEMLVVKYLSMYV